MEFQVQKVFQTKPDKKVPTHGPGTSAYYRGKPCKVLSIANGKAKIFVDGRILIVNYTSIDDQMYGKMSEGFRVVNEKTHKSLFTGSQDECDNYVKENDLEEDENIKVIKLDEAIVNVPRNGQTFQKIIDKHPRLSLDPLFYGPAVLCRKWEMLDKSDINAWLNENDRFRKNYVTRLKIIDGKAAIEFVSKKTSNNITAIFYYSPESGEQWFVPADGRLNEAITLPKDFKYGWEPEELDLSVKEENFIKKYIKSKKIYQLPDYDEENGREVKQFKTLANLLSKAQVLEELKISSREKYIAYKLPKGTVVVYYSGSEFIGKCFYLPSASINESEAQEKYQAFFKQKLSDYGVSSPAELSTEDKSKFFAEIKKEWPDAKINESAAFGVGSTVILDGEQCKVVSISNGECKVVCNGTVKKCNMSKLKPIVPMNEEFSTSVSLTLPPAVKKNKTSVDKLPFLNDVVDQKKLGFKEVYWGEEGDKYYFNHWVSATGTRGVSTLMNSFNPYLTKKSNFIPSQIYELSKLTNLSSINVRTEEKDKSRIFCADIELSPKDLNNCLSPKLNNVRFYIFPTNGIFN